MKDIHRANISTTGQGAVSVVYHERYRRQTHDWAYDNTAKYNFCHTTTNLCLITSFHTKQMHIVYLSQITSYIFQCLLHHL